ncbi:unnamed protein product [Hydatigera taeniaeformis]|uniref:RING-type domain-containing protein n=1 Tax=Hydatigena taeniaeformis TaxID=6205 RepID=A0A0R3X253_HYDTA|nr:unnamed protein product [Hydatigera taeniaeformis]
MLFLKQLVCSKLDCDPHTHFLAYHGVQLSDWDVVSSFDFIANNDASVDVLPRSSINNCYVLCYDCDNVTPAVFATVCEKCASLKFEVLNGISSPQIRTVSGTCMDCGCTSSTVLISCSNDATHSRTIFLKQVVRNFDHLICIACCSEATEVIVKFCENRGHILCLDCFRTYAESYLSDAKFVLVPDIGYTLPCPLGCPKSYIADTHLFRVLGRAFYSRYKECAARFFCYTEGCISCPNCGNFWERKDDLDLNSWITCEKPYGCGVEFCSRCRNIAPEVGTASQCTCAFGESLREQSLGDQIIRRGIAGAWNGVKFNSSDLATYSLISVTYMPTGHVRAPLIVPLRLPVEGQYKNSIDSSTQVEISTDTPLARVYFTIDGSRPDPTSWKPRHPQPGPTYHFQKPFTLSPGVKTIKAIAFIPSDIGQSSPSSRSPDGRFTRVMETTPQKGNRVSMVSDEEDKPKKAPSKLHLYRSNRLQRKVDIFNCPTCLASRPIDNDAAFCSTCGTSLPRLPSPIISSTQMVANSDVCTICGSRMVVNTTKCLVCESPKARVKKALIGEPDSMDRRLCSACGSLNPTRVKYCLTCEAVLPLTAANLVNISPLLRKSPNSPPPPPTSTNTTSSNRMAANCRICSRQNSLGARFCDWCGIQNPCDVDLASHLQSCAVCPKCFWQTPRDSRFCSQCGFSFAGASESSSMYEYSLGKLPFVRYFVYIGHSTHVPGSENHSMLSITPRANRSVSTQTVGFFYPRGGHDKPPKLPDRPIKSLTRSRPHLMGFVSPGKGMFTTPSFDLQYDHAQHNSSDIMHLVYADVDESQPDEVVICFTFKRHGPLPRVCALGETSEAPIDVAENGDRMSLSPPTSGPRYRRQTNNSNTTEFAYPLRAASTPILKFDPSYTSGADIKSPPSLPVDQPFRSSSPNSSAPNVSFLRGLDNLQVRSIPLNVLLLVGQEMHV